MNFPTSPEELQNNDVAEVLEMAVNDERDNDANNDDDDIIINNISGATVAELFRVNNFLAKMQSVTQILMSNLKGCDAQWTLFVAAAMSYRYKQVLSICPPWFFKDGHIDIDALATVISDTPSLTSFLHDVEQEDLFDVDNRVYSILFWLLCSQNKYLECLDYKDGTVLLKNLQYPIGLPKPDYIFEIKSLGEPSFEDNAFSTESAYYPVFWTYFGDRLDSFIGLMYKGFHSYTSGKNKELKLHLDVKTAFNNSPSSPAWGGSLLSPSVSCVAVVECINRTEHVRRLNELIYVNNTSLTKIKYFLFYCKQLEMDHEPSKWSLIWRFIKKRQKPLKLIGCLAILSSFYLIKREIRIRWISYAKSQGGYLYTTIANAAGQYMINKN